MFAVAKLVAMRIRILVTGFGKFPGARRNPTALLIHELRKHRARLSRLGIALELDVLPVVYREVPIKLRRLEETLKPDALLHFGLAARSKLFKIETRALNRSSLLHCDASGRRAPHRVIVPGAPHIAKSTFPGRQIEAALRRAKLHGQLSIDAGDYVCNQSLMASLAQSKARAIGFIHVPRIAPSTRRNDALRKGRPSLRDLIQVALIAILITARKIRQDRAIDFAKGSTEVSFSTRKHYDFVMKPAEGPALDLAPFMA
ncbi:hypothetical protein CU048_14090 [Beijerinckiaceae bacterium]|nr:hypothetical protein CU048_14090 [Beijerinckiaceae bacterium]